MVVKMGGGLSIIKRCSDSLTPHSKKQVLQALVLFSLYYYPVMLSSAEKKDLVQLQLAQNTVHVLLFIVIRGLIYIIIISLG
jgi:hypothetical protein